jgi:hypothetical protein
LTIDSLAQPDAIAFMKDLQDGYFPYELKFMCHL